MRVFVPTNGSLKIVDALTKRLGFSIQNVGAVDIYYSDDQRQLDSVSAADLPSVGHLLPATNPVQQPVVYPWFYGNRIFIRAQGAGALCEVLIYDVDKC